MKKLLPLLLAIIMVVSVLAACNDTPAQTSGAPKETQKKEESQINQTDSTTPAETDPVDTVPEEEQLNIDIDALDYNNKDFYIYHWDTDPFEDWSSDSLEFEPDSQKDESDPINNALYLRNLYVEEALGIKLHFHAEPGHDHYQASFVETMLVRLQDPETPVDLIGAYSRAAPHVLLSGLAVDLEAYSDDLDLSKA